MKTTVGGITTNYRILRNNKRVQKNNKAFFTTTRLRATMPPTEKGADHDTTGADHSVHE